MTTTEIIHGSDEDATERTLLQAVGGSYFPIALIARLPYAMMVVGVLTLVVAGRESVALGGLTSAMAGLGTAIFGPLIGATADRFGQRRVVLVAGVANSLVLLLITAAVFSRLPDALVLALAFVVGATAPQVSPMSRSRLVGVVTRRIVPDRRRRVLDGTLAYESAADEVTFVFGPVITGLLATTLGPAAAMIGAAAVALVFVTAFALHRTGETVAVQTVTGETKPGETEPGETGPGETATGEQRRPVQAPSAELFRPGLLVVFLGTFGVGLFFGAMLTSLTSFMGETGDAERAGLVYGAVGIGSAVFALAVAAFPARFSLRARWIAFAAIMVVGTALLPLVGTVATMLPVLLLIGVGIGPTLVTQFGFAAARSPHGRSATVMTMASTGVVVGQAASSAVTGQLAEQFGTASAMYAPLVAAVVVAAAGVANAIVTGRHR